MHFGSWHQHSLLLVCFSCFFTIKMVYAVGACVCVCVCACVMHVFTHVYISVRHICVQVTMCMHVCVCARHCVCCVCMCVCAYVHAFWYACLHEGMCKIFLPTSTISLSFNVENCTVSR